MKVEEVKKPNGNSPNLVETLESISNEPDMHADVLGLLNLAPGSPKYTEASNKLSRLKKSNPRLYKKIVNFN